MKPEFVLYLFCFAFVAVVYLAFEVLVFRLACRLARVGQPTTGRTIAMTFAVVLAVFVAEGILATAVERAYTLGGFPLWEAGLVGFFLGLPVHMALASVIHAKMMRVTMGEAVGVWFVEKSMKLGLMAVVAGLFGVLLLVQRMTG
jgi:hypothetical protein